MTALWVTQCGNCGSTLRDDEHGLCKLCREEEEEEEEKEKEKEKEKSEINKEIEKRVKIELAKMTKQTETLVIQNLNGKQYKLTGYWENGIFNTVE